MTEKTIIELINQLFELEKKKNHLGYEKLDRNIERMKHLIEEEGYSFHNPTGELYNETRIDCQATILKDEEPFTISDTIKPIIFSKTENTIIQQARVIVQ